MKENPARSGYRIRWNPRKKTQKTIPLPTKRNSTLLMEPFHGQDYRIVTPIQEKSEKAVHPEKDPGKLLHISK